MISNDCPIDKNSFESLCDSFQYNHPINVIKLNRKTGTTSSSCLFSSFFAVKRDWNRNRKSGVHSSSILEPSAFSATKEPRIPNSSLAQTRSYYQRPDIFATQVWSLMNEQPGVTFSCRTSNQPKRLINFEIEGRKRIRS